MPNRLIPHFFKKMLAIKSNHQKSSRVIFSKHQLQTSRHSTGTTRAHFFPNNQINLSAQDTTSQKEKKKRGGTSN